MESIRRLLEEIVYKLFEVKTEVEVTVAPELNEGFRADFASNVAMKICKDLRKNPREVAEEIKEEFLRVLSSEKAVEEIEGNGNEEKTAEITNLRGTRVEVAGPGFLNFMLPDEYFKEKLAKMGGKYEDFLENISQDEYKDKVVVTEFSDPNPFKVLHVGHLYTSVMGEAISRLIEFAGGEVHRTNFGGDVGLHVAKTIYVLRKFSSFAESEESGLRIEDIAKAYVEGTRAYEENEEAHKEIVRLNKIIYKIAEFGEGNYQKLWGEEREIAEIYWRGRELSYKYFEQFYDKIGVKFEKFYPESTVAERGLEEVKTHTGEVYEESNGAVVFSGEKYGLHTRVFINKEGLPTYEAKDVGLLFTKWDDYKFDESVVITGNDIIEYMKVVLKSVEQYAPELVKRTRHITHGNVRLPGNEKMSSRKGNFIKAVDVLEDVQKEIKGKDERLMLGAVKYGFLKYKIGGNIEFNIKDAVSLTGNSGIYLLYSAVRAKKILSLSSQMELGESWQLNQYEIAICKKFLEYKNVLFEAVKGKAPHLICNYLFETAQEFSRFYENCKVNGDEREAERREIVLVFERIIEHGLGLLGIEIPESM